MATGDRIFWGAVTFIFVCLVWLKWVEKYVSIWVGAVVAAIAFLAILRLPRPRNESGPPSQARR